MSEEELIQQYYLLQGAIKDVLAQLEAIYVPQVSQAIDNKDAEALREILRRCPDTVICAFIHDAGVQSGILPRINWLEKS